MTVRDKAGAAPKSARKPAQSDDSGPPEYSVSTLARALDVDQAQVSRWKAAGMRFDARGRVSLAAAVAWLREHERRERPQKSGKEITDRLAQIDLERAELRLLRERDAVVLRADVEQAAEEEALRVAAIVGGLATLAVPLLVAQTGCTRATAALTARAIADGLRDRLASEDEEGPDVAPPAPAEAGA